MRKNPHRLSTDVAPRRYVLTLEPDLGKFTFAGEEAIEIVVGRPVRTLTLHAKDLAVRYAAVAASGGDEMKPVRSIVFDAEAETVTFELAARLPAGVHHLHIGFSGVLNDIMRGFYRSSYRVGKEIRSIATTQFEATDARRAFPCFDEPFMKAVFDVSLVVPKEKVAISNTIPTRIRKRADGKKVVTFAPTPKMSTYLLAFVVGDFECVQKRTPEGVLVRVFVTADKKRQARFALDCAVRTLSFFGDYFDIPYPLPVLDMIAIPDFASQAMENWGAITYRESALLFDEEHSSTENKQWVALVIAHELAHQWFGNLVTMEWWTHLWLNEGFASYIEYVAVDHLFPEWHIWDRFVSAELSRALRLDALANTHPIEVEVRHPGEISEIFDDVSYRKGASVIRMLADYLGEEKFRQGLSYYLKTHSYANTSTVHLWEAFQKVSRKPVVGIMRNWTSAEGHPLITAASSRGRIGISQQRFFLSARSAKAGQGRGQKRWAVPVRAAALGSGRRTLTLFGGTRGALSLPGAKADRPVKLNAGEVGVFRSNYPSEWWPELATAVATAELGTADRLGLMRDAIALAEAGKLPTVQALEFARSYAEETEYVVWLEVAAALHRVYGLIAEEPFGDAYRSFARGIFAGVAERMGWEHDPHDTHTGKILRSLALSQVGLYGDDATVAKAKKLFAGITATTNTVPADLRDAVYNLAAQYGEEKEHAKLIRLYRATELHEERNRLGVALGRFQPANLLEKSLEFAVSRQVRIQDTYGILASVWLNPQGRKVAWEFAKRHWKLLLDRYQDGHTLPRIVSLAGTFTKEEEARDVERFFGQVGIPEGAARTLAQALEEARGRAAWAKRDKAALRRWLSGK